MRYSGYVTGYQPIRDHSSEESWKMERKNFSLRQRKKGNADTNYRAEGVEGAQLQIKIKGPLQVQCR